MSIRLMSQVWEDTRVESQSELLVLLALADHARDDGLCWPSMRSIAVKARIEERSAQRIVRRLIEKGLIELVSQGGCIDGCNTPNRYIVVLREPRQTHGVTDGRPGVTVSQGVRGDLASPRGDPEDSNGVTQGHPNHQIEPLTERITTTYRQAAKKPIQENEPTGASSSRSDSRAIREVQESGLLQARVSGLVNRLTVEFGLSNKQREAVREYCNSLGIEYVDAKADIVRMQPRKNAAGALLAALRDDWQAPVSVAGAVETEGDHLGHLRRACAQNGVAMVTVKATACRSCGKQITPVAEPVIVCGRPFAIGPTVCTACADATETEKRTIELSRWQRMCPALYRHTEIGRLQDDLLHHGYDSRWMHEVLAWQYGSRGIVISGPTGVGKSRLMWLLLRRLLDEENRTAVFLNAVRFRTGVQAAGRDGTSEEFVRRLVRTHVLYWDDLGQMHLTGAASEMLLHLLEERICAGRPILATTQYSGKGMDAQFERPEMGQAIRRRLNEFCRVVTIRQVLEPRGVVSFQPAAIR